MALALFSGLWLCGQTPVKDKADDYPAHAALGAASIGAEYLVHSIPAHNQTLITRDYLVVEVAVFPGRGEPVQVGNSTFRLRVNGKKQVLYLESTGFVAASMTYPDWEQRPNAQVSAGVGDAGVVLGRPPVVGRFPDDPRPGHSRLPRPPQAPAPDDRRGVDQEEPASPADVVAQTALPEGATAKPVSGYIYFRYEGKVKSIKSVELIFAGRSGSVTLKLM